MNYLKTIFSHLIIFLFTSYIVIGQDDQMALNVQVGQLTKHKAKNAFIKINPISYDNGNLYGITYSYLEIGPNFNINDKYRRLIKINNNLEDVEFKKIELKKNGKETDYEFMIAGKKTTRLFTSFQNRKDKKVYLFSQSVDLPSLQINNDATKIAEIDYSNFNKYKYDFFNYSMSSDSSKIIFWHNLTTKKGQSLSRGVAVYDQDYNEIWKTENINIKGFSEGTYIHYTAFKVNDKGDAAILCKYFKNEDEFHDYSRIGGSFGSIGGNWTKKPTYQYTILHISDNGTVYKPIKPKSPDNHLIELRMGVTPDGQDFYCTGLYGEPSSMDVLGSFMFEVTGLQQEVEVSYHPFSEDLISTNTEDEDQAKGYYKISKIYFSDQGEMWNIAELNDKRRYSKGSQAAGYTTTTEYYHSDLIITKYRSDGSLDWAKKVKKRQFVENNILLDSYKSHLDSDGNLYLFYTEGAREVKKRGYPKGMKKGKVIFYCVKITKDGEVYKSEIDLPEDFKSTLHPYFAGYFSKNSLFICANRRATKYQFVRIDIP